MREQLVHLPENKRRELERVARILFDEFEDAQKTRLSEKDRKGRILKLILFGSYARGDWVEDRRSGYSSDYDLLVIVNAERFADQHVSWEKAGERFVRELTVTRHLETPVNFIVHSIMDVNDQLAHGRPFFIDIARDGIVLYEVPGHALASPKKLTADEMRVEARRHFDHWFPLACHALKLAQDSITDNVSRDAAFMLHQATERLYHCALLVLTLYSPKSHRLSNLRSHAERTDPRLIEAWPRDTKFARRCFSRADRAYVDARYSAEYVITGEELAWLVERVKVLIEIVATICAEQLETGRKTGAWTHDNIIAAETAIETLNQARAMILARHREISEDDRELAAKLRAKRRELLALQKMISPEDPAAARAVTEEWGLRIKDQERFWRELDLG
ncbi:HEPN domain-containing protein [Brucella anthropi]|uniref:HEPN domain-containing protein n=1 Tax=Brucella anthropi TaxID=529 RepID=UPI000F67816C|nr:HEPN domain-containing protein [Brucella anthropi]